jgi:hypothetical protein
LNSVSVEFVAGGSDIFELVSSHRFEVTARREEEEDGGEEEASGRGDVVTVTFSHVSCNSVTGRPYSTFTRVFHGIYSRLLFADGIRAVLETNSKG